MSERKAAALERLLAEERDLILSGRFDGLQDLTVRKLDVLAELPDWDLGSGRLSGIATKVTRNQNLLEAAIRGMKTARVRIEAVIGAAGTLSTYDSSGQKTDLGVHRSDLRKKA